LHGREKVSYGAAGCQGEAERPEILANYARVHWYIAAKRGKIRALPEGPLKELQQLLERCKAQVRAKVERAFHVVKNLFRHRKVRYWGLGKNLAQLYSFFGLANLYKACLALATSAALNEHYPSSTTPDRVDSSRPRAESTPFLRSPTVPAPVISSLIAHHSSIMACLSFFVTTALGTVAGLWKCAFRLDGRWQVRGMLWNCSTPERVQRSAS
jgi:hypothetical protein